MTASKCLSQQGSRKQKHPETDLQYQPNQNPKHQPLINTLANL